MLRKKGAAEGTAAIVVIIVIVVVIGGFFLINEVNKECSKNADCDEEFYCGADFQCHEKEIVYKTQVKQDLVIPAIIIALSIILFGIIIRSKNIQFKLPEGFSFPLPKHLKQQQKIKIMSWEEDPDKEGSAQEQESGKHSKSNNKNSLKSK